MSDSLRLFVAVPLPQALQAYLAKERQVYTDPAVRLVPEQNLHLTLYFIGNILSGEEENIKSILADVARQHGPFTLTLEQVEPGPRVQSPRLVWARFTQNEAFSQLSRALTQRLSTSSPKHDKYIPHVTLARFRKDLPVPSPLPLVKPSQEILFPVHSLALWRSVLGSPHPGYTLVEEYPLELR